MDRICATLDGAQLTLKRTLSDPAPILERLARVLPCRTQFDKHVIGETPSESNSYGYMVLRALGSDDCPTSALSQEACHPNLAP